jgi:hypothetical protein
MNTHANRKLTLEDATRYVTTQSEPFALKYERLDPESLRRLTDRIEAEARAMRAQVLRKLLRSAGAFVYRSVMGLFASAHAPARRERLSA